MDPEIRGKLETTLDALTSDRGLKNALTVISSIKPAISSVEDAVFGYIVGSIHCLFVINIDMKYDRDANDDEINGFYQMINIRALQLRSNIRSINNR